MASKGQPADQGSHEYATYPSLRGKKVLITGGATGIGEVLVSRFAEQGAQVALLDVQDDLAKELVGRVANNGNLPPLYLHCELSDVTAIRESVARVISS